MPTISDERWDILKNAWLQENNVNIAAEAASIALPTARRYIFLGDPNRGREAIAKNPENLEKPQKTALNKKIYQPVTATIESFVQHYKEALAVRLSTLHPEEIDGRFIVIIEKLDRLERSLEERKASEDKANSVVRIELAPYNEETNHDEA